MKILDDVEPEVIFKNILWTIGIIISVAYCVTSFILPTVNAYKYEKYTSKTGNNTLSQIKAAHNTEEIQLATLIKENKQVLNVFYAKPNIGALTRMLQKYFTRMNISIVTENDNKEMQLKETLYKISGNSSDLSAIMNIPKILQKQNINAVLSLPLSIKKTGRLQDPLDFTMHILITTSYYKHDKNVFK